MTMPRASMAAAGALYVRLRRRPARHARMTPFGEKMRGAAARARRSARSRWPRRWASAPPICRRSNMAGAACRAGRWSRRSSAISTSSGTMRRNSQRLAETSQPARRHRHVRACRRQPPARQPAGPEHRPHSQRRSRAAEPTAGGGADEVAGAAVVDVLSRRKTRGHRCCGCQNSACSSGSLSLTSQP